MAFYRQLQCSFWRDAFVQNLTPEEKYFYAYLLTNEFTKQTGIYQITKRYIGIDTGYNDETVTKLLERFASYKKILYNEETKELMILNWLKHNWSNSPLVLKCVEKELKEVRTPEFIKIYKETVYKLYQYDIEALLIALGKNKNKNNNKNNFKNKNNPFSIEEESLNLISEGEDMGEGPGIEQPVPNLNKNLVIKPLFEVWIHSYNKARNTDYDVSDFDLEYSALDCLLNIYYTKPQNAGKFKESLIEDFKNIFDGALTIQDNYYFAKMSLPFLSKNFNEVKSKILQRMNNDGTKQVNGNQKQSGILNAIMDQLVK